MKTIGIMQPTYLPWIGYFAMIDVVDRFVFLDSVQFAKRSWQQRNRIKTPNGAQWITLPVTTKGQREQLIKDVQLDPTQDFGSKMINTLRSNYGRASYFAEYSEPFFEIFANPGSEMATLNIRLIRLAMEMMGMDQSKLASSSELEVNGAKADLLADICRHEGFTHYISAPGSKDYIDESDAFERAGIRVDYHEYSHPSYSQLFGPFESHMSIVDLLFNEGPNAATIMRSGLHQATGSILNSHLSARPLEDVDAGVLHGIEFKG